MTDIISRLRSRIQKKKMESWWDICDVDEKYEKEYYSLSKEEKEDLDAILQERDVCLEYFVFELEDDDTTFQEAIDWWKNRKIIELRGRRIVFRERICHRCGKPTSKRGFECRYYPIDYNDIYCQECIPQDKWNYDKITYQQIIDDTSISLKIRKYYQTKQKIGEVTIKQGKILNESRRNRENEIANARTKYTIEYVDWLNDEEDK